MTIICALNARPHGEVWIGCDTRVLTGDFIWPEIDRKIAKLGRWTLLFAGSAMAMRAAFSTAALIQGAESPEAIQKILFQEYRERGFKQDDHDGPPCYGQETIVCDAAHVWVITANGCVSAELPFAAAGSGAEYAFGAWHAVRGRGLSPEQIVVAALEAACAFDTGCGGQLVVEKVE